MSTAKTLILPLVSTGNVPQLTTDLILHSLSSEFNFVKSIDSQYLHPFVGPLDHTIEEIEPVLYAIAAPEKKFSTALELFYSESKGVYVIQQRTPVIQGYLNNFIKETLIPLIDELNVTHVTILDSYGALDDTVVKRKFGQTVGNIDPFYSLGNCEISSAGHLANEFESILNLQMDPETSLHFTNSLLTFTSSSLLQEISTDQPIFKIIYHLLNSQINLVNVRYCSFFAHEGDNSFDARLFCSHFNDFIQNTTIGSECLIKDFKSPISWKGVYGFSEVPSTIDEGIYI